METSELTIRTINHNMELNGPKRGRETEQFL